MNDKKDPRIEDILIALDIIKQKLPNGELEVIKRSMTALGEDQKIIKDDLEYFKRRLFNPDDGVIVRIHKNTDSLEKSNENLGIIPEISNRVSNVEKWQGGVNKAMWFLFSTIGGIIIAMIFSLLNKNKDFRVKKNTTKIENGIKSTLLKSSNLFESLNLRYFGPVDGHDVDHMVAILSDLKNIPGPMGVMGRNSDNALIKELVGWTTNEDLEYGLKITYNWISQQIENNSLDT